MRKVIHYIQEITNRIKIDCFSETNEVRRQWPDVYKVLKKKLLTKNCISYKTILQ